MIYKQFKYSVNFMFVYFLQTVQHKEDVEKKTHSSGTEDR